MTVLVVGMVSVNPDEPDALAEYLRVTGPLLEQVGAKVVQTFEVGQSVVGDQMADSMMVVEYPSLDALDSVFGSAAYKSIIPARDKAFRTYNVSIVNV